MGRERVKVLAWNGVLPNPRLYTVGETAQGVSDCVKIMQCDFRGWRRIPTCTLPPLLVTPRLVTL